MQIGMGQVPTETIEWFRTACNDGGLSWTALAWLSELDWEIPGTRRRRIAVQTMRDWLRRYRRLGIDGLKPKRRKSAAPRWLQPETVETLLAIRQHL